MLKSSFTNSNFSPKRLIFQNSPEQPAQPATQPSLANHPESLEDHDKKALLEIQSRARQTKRDVEKQDIIETAKVRAETKDKLTGIKLQSEQPKLLSNGQFEQSFDFGDQKLSGKLIYPKENDPSKPTTYLFTFTDKLNPLDVAAIQETLKKSPNKLGNTIIVQMQTPTEQVKLNGKAVPLLKTLTEDLRKYQGLPELAKLQEVSSLLAVTDPEKSEQVNKLLEEYRESASKNDPKAPTQAISYSELAEKIADISESDSEQEEPAEHLTRIVVNRGGPKSKAQPATPSVDNDSTPTQQISDSAPSLTVPNVLNDLLKPNSKSETSSNTSLASGIPESSESNDQEPIKGYTGFFGDSNLEAFVNPKKFLNLADGGKGYAIRGHNTRQLMSQQMGLDKDGNPKGGKDSIPDLDKMEKVVINCGLNDAFSNMKVSEITKNLKIIVNYFLKKGKKVYLTTLSPFGGYQSPYVTADTKRDGQTIEERRLAINNFILNDLKGLSGLRIIPVHLTKAEGGVSSGQKDHYGNETLDSAFNSGDKLHFKPTEFAKLLKRYLKEENSSSSLASPLSNLNVSPSTDVSNPFKEIMSANDKYWSKNVYGAPKGFSGGGVSQAAALRSREILNQGGMKAGEYKEETIDGVTYAFMHEGHPKSPSDHSSWHPSISVYVKKDQKKPAQNNSDKSESKTT